MDPDAATAAASRTGAATGSSSPSRSLPPPSLRSTGSFNAIRTWSWRGSRWSALGPLYGLVYPRDTRIVRLVVVALSLILRLLRKPVRGFVRPVDAIERVVRENGLSPYFSQRVAPVWQVDHREPVRSARPVAVFRVTVAARW